MIKRKPAWDYEEPLTDLTPYVDWDPVMSMIRSLKLYLVEWGTVPTWNFMFCHGRPELAVPGSWAWTWPSVFGYMLAPVQAIFAVWLLMTAIGFFSTRALLLRWTENALAAGIGATVYAFSGYYANRFNAGHITFAFYHWIPLLIYLFEIAFDQGIRSRPNLRPLLLITLTSFLFITSGLPHPLLHFYPVLLLFIAFRVLQRSFTLGFVASLRAGSLPILANLLGIVLGAYKLWPVIDWQRQFPRVGVLSESYSVVEVISNTLIFVTDYFSPARQQPWHLYPAWGYNAFVGPVPWLCAGIAIYAAIRSRKSIPAEMNRDRLGALTFGLLLVMLGIAVSLGNNNPWSPASLFRYLPVLEGVRAFNRYQILIVFGLSICTALGFAALSESLAGKDRWRRVVLGGLAVATLGPLLSQTFLLARNIPASRNAKLFSHSARATSAPLPEYVHLAARGLRTPGQQSAVLEAGNWIDNCYANITLPGGPPTSNAGLRPISFPPPIAIEELTHDSIRMRYATDVRGLIRLNLRVLDDFQTDAPRRRLEGWQSIRSEDLVENGLTLRAESRALQEGYAASCLGVLLSVGFFVGVARRERSFHTSAARNSS